MSALIQLPGRGTLRSLELIVLQFLVIVILPNNDVGTSELPAISAQKVAAATGSRPVLPSQGKRAPVVAKVRHELPQGVGGRAAQLRLPLPPHAAALQLSQRLRI